MKTKMKIVRKNMLARDLKGLMELPNYDDNQLVEVTVYPTEEERKLSPAERKKILDSLVGCLKGVDPSKTLDDWRRERLEEKHGIKLAD